MGQKTVADRGRVGVRATNTPGVNRSTKTTPILIALRSVPHRSINSLRSRVISVSGICAATLASGATTGTTPNIIRAVPNPIPRVHPTGGTRSIVEAVTTPTAWISALYRGILPSRMYTRTILAFAALWIPHRLLRAGWSDLDYFFCDTRLISLHS